MKTASRLLMLLIGTIFTLSFSGSIASAAELPALQWLIPGATLAASLLVNTKEAAFSFAVPPMSISDIERYAEKNLSNFDGQFIPFEGGGPNAYFEGYTGQSDDFLDFGGSPASFASEFDTDLQFTINIAKSATAGTVYLIPGLQYYAGRTANGFLTNTGGTDTAGNALTSASGSPANITDFYDFIAANPTRLLGLRVSSSDATQLDQTIVYLEQSPFRSLASRNIALSSISDQNTFNRSLGKIETPGMIISSQTRMALPMPASAQTTVVFYCGAVLNTSLALQKKADKAKMTLQTVGVAAVRAAEAKGLASGQKMIIAGR
jgi:hypothetical protein